MNLTFEPQEAAEAFFAVILRSRHINITMLKNNTRARVALAFSMTKAGSLEVDQRGLDQLCPLRLYFEQTSPIQTHLHQRKNSRSGHRIRVMSLRVERLWPCSRYALIKAVTSGSLMELCGSRTTPCKTIWLLDLDQISIASDLSAL